MYAFLRTPRWLAATALLALAVLACLLLGSWQWDRAHTQYAVTFADPLDQAAVPVASALPPGEDGLPPAVPADAEATPVTASGTYDSEHQWLVPGREVDGTEGSYVLTPLLGVDGLDPDIGLLVLRGFVAGVPDSAPASPLGTVEVTGWLVPPEPYDSPVDPDLPAVLPEGQVATVTTARVLGEAGRPLVDGYVGLRAQDPASELTPVPPPPPPKGGIRWSVQSLAYTFEWYAFAIAAVVMWVLAVRRHAQDLEAERSPERGRG